MMVWTGEGELGVFVQREMKREAGAAGPKTSTVGQAVLSAFVGSNPRVPHWRRPVSEWRLIQDNGTVLATPWLANFKEVPLSARLAVLLLTKRPRWCH